jgi:hypothetical protein
VADEQFCYDGYGWSPGCSYNSSRDRSLVPVDYDVDLSKFVRFAGASTSASAKHRARSTTFIQSLEALSSIKFISGHGMATQITQRKQQGE